MEKDKQRETEMTKVVQKAEQMVQPVLNETEMSQSKLAQ